MKLETAIRNMYWTLKLICGDKCAEQNPCDSKEAYRLYEKALRQARKKVAKPQAPVKEEP